MRRTARETRRPRFARYETRFEERPGDGRGGVDRSLRGVLIGAGGLLRSAGRRAGPRTTPHCPGVSARAPKSRDRLSALRGPAPVSPPHPRFKGSSGQKGEIKRDKVSFSLPGASRSFFPTEGRQTPQRYLPSLSAVSTSGSQLPWSPVRNGLPAATQSRDGRRIGLELERGLLRLTAAHCTLFSHCDLTAAFLHEGSTYYDITGPSLDWPAVCGM